MDRKERALVMNTAIVTMSGSNMGVGFAVPVDWFKLSMEDIIFTEEVEGNECGGWKWR